MQAEPTGAELAAVRSAQAVGGRKSLMVVRMLLRLLLLLAMPPQLWQRRCLRNAAGLTWHGIPARLASRLAVI